MWTARWWTASRTISRRAGPSWRSTAWRLHLGRPRAVHRGQHPGDARRLAAPVRAHRLPGRAGGGAGRPLPHAGPAGTPVFEQMALLVERLHRAGVPMAVASGSSNSAITAVLTGTGLDDLLGPAVSAEEVPRGKPAPDVFLEAARRLGAAPVDCVVIEDAEPGVAAALAARMRCVAVPSVPPAADDPVFSAAGLLFPEGQPSFRAAETYDWIMRVPV
ncbi:HAD family hydrolase [Actinomadura keratinilytica]